MSPNLDPATVAGFGEEWTRFPQDRFLEKEARSFYSSYFALFPWDELPPNAHGFDMGCGSGRWAALVAPRVERLYCIDASPRCVEVASRNLVDHPNCVVLFGDFDRMPFADGSMDFGYCLGVLHHVPDPAAALAACVRKLKPGAPFLIYVYYALENRPLWYRWLWRASDCVRRALAAFPLSTRYAASQVIAATVYWPLARAAAFLERLGVSVETWPLAYYRAASFYTMRTDALDRLGTPHELRFTSQEIRRMMDGAGLCDIRFHPAMPYWCVVGRRKGTTG